MIDMQEQLALPLGAPYVESIAATLQRLARREAISDLDAHFGALMLELAMRPVPSVALAAALVSRATAAGHVCIDLVALAARAQFDGDWIAPPLTQWLEALERSGVVGDGAERRPLVLDGTRLYLYRYWRYETALAENLRRRVAQPSAALDESKLGQGLERLFAEHTQSGQQRAAAEAAVRGHLTVISGGPGTGKTTTVAKTLALLLDQRGSRRLSIALAAPTGKAAARLQEAISAARPGLGIDTAGDELLPRAAFTLHRLLGLYGAGKPPRHDAHNPLPLDVLVVDEASMIDLALAAKLAAALRPEARLILLGDKDQLASVEAGAVLACLCAGLPRENVVLLDKSWRFAAASGIGRIAPFIRAGDAEGTLEVLAAGHDVDLTWMQRAAPSDVVEAAIEGYRPLLDAVQLGTDPEAWLAALEGFRVLCATRGGPFGVEAINRGVLARLQARGLASRGARYHAGQPLMVTRNDYTLRLFNGDIGMVVPDEHASDGWVVVFATDAGLRRISTSRMPATETVYAMTVHKSQGSEFDAALVVLPQESSPILSRELLYTAVTRARRRAVIAATAERIRECVTRSVVRDSGLLARL